jgi:cell division protein FtsW
MPDEVLAADPPDLSLPSRGESIAGKLLLLIVALLMCIGILVVYSSGAGWAEKSFQTLNISSGVSCHLRS